MKKIALFITLGLLIFNFAVAQDAKPVAQEKDPRGFVQINANMLMFGDSNYKDVYDSSAICPEFKLGYGVTDSIYIWGSVSFVSADGTIPVLNEEASSKQTFISLGAGYRGEINDNMGYKFELGGLIASYKEEAMETEESGSAMGITVNAAIQYSFTDSLYVEGGLGYMYAKDTPEINGTKVDVKPGGFKLSLGVGFKF